MALNLVNLDGTTRTHMLEELDYDLQRGTLYISPRLSPTGADQYPQLLRQAIQSEDDDWLADQLRSGGRLKSHEERKTKSGVTMAKVPHTAPETLAAGEFNRFYARGLCRRAGEEGTAEVVVYRAKAVTSPRSASEAMIGQQVNAAALLEDLRSKPGVEPALGIPPGPNSGLSVKLP